MNDAGRASLEGDVRALCERGDYDGAATLALKGLGGEIYQFLVAVHRDPVMADECFSSFGEGLWRGLPSFVWTSTLRTWAYAIARNVGRAERRASARRGRKGVLAGSAAFENVAVAVRTATLSFLKTERRSGLDELRAALSEDERALLILRVDRGLPWNDVAQALSESAEPLSDAAVAREAGKLRKRFHDVKERLRDLAKKQRLGARGAGRAPR
jgi:RNA polymerase sigma-70 factor, ECF subfamily